MDGDVYLWRHGDQAAKIVAAKGMPVRDTRRKLLERTKNVLMGGVVLTWYLFTIGHSAHHSSADTSSVEMLRILFSTYAGLGALAYVFGKRISNWFQRSDLKRMLKKKRIIIAPRQLVVDFEAWCWEIGLNEQARGLYFRGFSASGTQVILSEWFGMVEMLLDVAALHDNPLLSGAERTKILNRLTDYAIALAEAEQHFGLAAREDAEAEQLLAETRLQLERELERDLRDIEAGVLAEEAVGLLALIPTRPVIPV
jgi:hypothetical protein